MTKKCTENEMLHNNTHTTDIKRETKMPVHPSCYKVQSKMPRTLTKDWLRRAVEKAYTQQEWQEKFRTELTAKDQFDILVRLQPKQILQQNQSLMRLVISGLQPGEKVVDLEGPVETKMIETHQEDEDD